jgi:OmcA/MtrC family decaheme c-type cytochrome
MACHRSDGTGVAPRLTAHGNNRTEEPQVCVVCHNPNNTDIPFRLNTHPKARIGPYVFPEQSIDFKTMIHGIHASAAGYRRTDLVVIGRNGAIFDAGTLERYPRNPRDCAACHVDDGARGTFELPPAPTVLGSTFNTRSFLPDGTVKVDADPANDVKVTPTAAICSSCHDSDKAVAHMVQTGRASFSAAGNQAVAERCATCHGPGRDKSVRKVHR